MNTKQTAALQRFTRTVAQFMEGASFTITELGDDILVSAINSGAHWSAPIEGAYAFIGVRGGVKVKEGNKYIRKWATR